MELDSQRTANDLRDRVVLLTGDGGGIGTLQFLLKGNGVSEYFQVCWHNRLWFCRWKQTMLWLRRYFTFCWCIRYDMCYALHFYLMLCVSWPEGVTAVLSFINEVYKQACQEDRNSFG